MTDRLQSYAWDGAYLLRGLFDAVRWPFERAAWAIERGLIWPLEERTGEWSGALRGLGALALVLLAAAVGVLGLVWVKGGGDGGTKVVQSSLPLPSQGPAAAGQTQAAPAPVLHGAKPDFKLESVGGSSRVSESGSPTEPSEGPAEGTASTAAASSAASSGKPAGPAAVKVAHRFAGAFVLYETGRADAKVRAAFGETATPRLARTLLRRPPRLPANTKVPRAEVLNIVPGPHHGDDYALSVSLLRLGITSELRIEMQRDKKTKAWLVTDVLG